MLAHLAAFVVTGFLHIDAFVFGHGIAIINPQEGTNLLLRVGSQHLLHTVKGHFDDFARSHAVAGLIVEVDVAVALGCQHVAFPVLADDNRGAAVIVARGDDTILGEDEHRAGALHLIIYVLDAIHEILTLCDEQGDQLGGIGTAHAQLGKVLLAGQAVVDQLVHIVDLGHRGDGKLAKVRVDDDRLSIGVADDGDTVVADEFVLTHLVAELGAEIGVLDVVDRTVKHSAVVGDSQRRRTSLKRKVFLKQCRRSLP